LKTTLFGTPGKRTGLVIQQRIKNVGMMNMTGLMSNITIGPKHQFYQFRKGSENNCKYIAASKMVMCSWTKMLESKMSWKVWFAVANMGTLPAASTTKVAASTTKVAASTTKVAASTTKAASTTGGAGQALPNAGWKAVVMATGMDYKVSAPLYIKNKVQSQN
jgi:hypothetical protein